MTKGELEQLRNALADYIWSEGCSCCQNREPHEDSRKRLGVLLKIEPDKEGWYDFVQYRTAHEPGAGL